MRSLGRGRFVVVLTLAAVVAVSGTAGAVQGPELEGDPDDMAEALSCPESFDDPDHDPVLLVHGTYATPEENWSWNYGAALPEQGWDVCTVRLPDRSTGDIQVSTEYVVYAVREISRRSGEPVDVMGHSQGGLQIRWAVRWWPDVTAAVDDVILLAAPNHGTVLADLAYDIGCHPSCYQMAAKSNFVAALNSGDETPGEADYTSIYSLTDELVQPAAPEPTAAIEGASNILIQDLCPGRPVDHVGLAYDAAVHDMVIDALTNGGPADPGRFDSTACAAVWFDGVDPSPFPDLLFDNALTNAFGGGDFDGPGAEPPLKPYATGSGPGGAADGEGEGDSEGGPGGGAGTATSAEAGGIDGGATLPATGGLPWGLLALGLVSPAIAAFVRRRGSVRPQRR